MPDRGEFRLLSTASFAGLGYTPIWNRKHPDKVGFYVMASKVGNKPGQETALTDKDFDAKKPSITNAKAFANEEGANRWFAYPRWTKDEKAIVYHASPSLYFYTLADKSTVKVSTSDGADYRYPHCEATPK